MSEKTISVCYLYCKQVNGQPVFGRRRTREKQGRGGGEISGRSQAMTHSLTL